MKHDPERVARYLEAIEGEDVYDDQGIASDDFPEPLGQYLLIERCRYTTAIYVTTWDTPDDAADYHDGQEYPEDWPIVKLVDLDTGETREPATTTTWDG